MRHGGEGGESGRAGQEAAPGESEHQLLTLKRNLAVSCVGRERSARNDAETSVAISSPEVRMGGRTAVAVPVLVMGERFAGLLGQRIVRYLEQPSAGYEPFTASDPAALANVLQPGDVM